VDALPGGLQLDVAVLDRRVFCVRGTDFLRGNTMKLLVRTHQCNQPGFSRFANMVGVTIFSIDPESDLSSTPRMIMSLGAEKILRQ
jgi:hypothetical protein